MNISLTEIIDNTKIAREYALLGNYESSLVYYQSVLQQINRLILTLTDYNRSQQWQEVCTTTIVQLCLNLPKVTNQ